MRIEIDPLDLGPLADFPLRWRWTDSRYNVLSTADLATIRPLSGAKAAEIALLTQIHGPTQSVSTTSTTSEVQAWLQERVTDDQAIVVSWDDRMAVLTTWRVFVTYWDDFCYPSSDDVAVVPLSGRWLLQYDHEERFVFAHLPSEIP